MPQKLQLFGDKQIRTFWDDAEEKYYFCIIDVVETLTDSNDPKQYIKRIRQRDPALNSVWGTICTPPSIHFLRWQATQCQLHILLEDEDVTEHPEE